MAILLHPNNKIDLDSHYITENLKKVENILGKNEIFNKKEYIKWLKDFEIIYGKKQANLSLYISFGLIYLIGLFFISKFILRDKNSLLNQNTSLKNFKEFEDNIKSNYKNFKIYEFKYFDPIFNLTEKEDSFFFYSFALEISNFVFELDLPPEYFFDYLIQKIISPITRHKSGEYYTPPFLTKMMVKEYYSFGETVLDPCCGSGNFLSEVVKYILSQKEPIKKKIYAINEIYGYDINPISIFISKINLLYLLKEQISDINLNLYVLDSLFQAEKKVNKRFDLIIGNPPWYTYRDIQSVDYQEKVKELAEKLEIKPLPKNLLNLEISSLFFVKAQQTFMKAGAKIFFVITKGVITGSHTSRFRNFKGLNEIKVWTFDKKIEAIFNIDFICLFGKKLQDLEEGSSEEIKSYHFTLKSEMENIDYFKNIELELEKIDTLIPYSIEKKRGKTYVKKLVSKETIKNLLPLKESHYKSLFHKGADLNPRNLIFIRYDKINDTIVKINPDEKIFKRAKPPWNKKEFKDDIVERDYIFKVIKSTELVKFHIYNSYDVFLPLEKNKLSFNYDKLTKHAKRFYDKINNLYKQNKKETTKHKTLMDNLNRWSKLINQRQTSKIKVVYNNSGSILYSAVVEGNFLVTGDLCFYATNNLDEAHYLSAILNSNLLTEQVKIVKSSRHIFKLPLDFPIKRFDIENLNHQKLAQLGRKGQRIAKQTINSFIKSNETSYTKFKIQNLLNEVIKPILAQIDEILMRELQKS
ncbi:MAG: N-6 DNA methylase [Promethearchaeota archaeon]|nr:MAG: N-6 DNA methylase [Candidatus Lokiarchaeota archaeon]